MSNKPNTLCNWNDRSEAKFKSIVNQLFFVFSSLNFVLRREILWLFIIYTRTRSTNITSSSYRISFNTETCCCKI